MIPHDEFALLSAYLDGELDHADRTRLDTHLTTCADCRATLAGLRATMADLQALPEPAPTPQDSWALRAAIRRARSPMRRWQRYAYAAGAVAAAAIAVFAITQPGNAPSRDLAGALPEAADLSAVPLFSSTENLTALEAQSRLLELAGVEGRFVAPPGAALAPTPTTSAAPPVASKDSAGGETATLQSGQYNAFTTYAGPDADQVLSQIDTCVEVVRDSTQILLEPLKFEVATFEGKPAFLLYFHATDHYELWVMRRPDCDLLYFGQT